MLDLLLLSHKSLWLSWFYFNPSSLFSGWMMSTGLFLSSLIPPISFY
jgi:ammonia channel protein AmtB